MKEKEQISGEWVQSGDCLSVQSILKYLPPELSDIRLVVYPSLDSTNTRIKEYAAQGEPEGLVVIAQEQSLGRGRMGRSFYSPPASGIYISILLRPGFSAQDSLFLTTAAAVAAAESIEAVSGYKTEIKWVNDVFCHGKKVCGILTEAAMDAESDRLEYAVTGIGINVREPKGGFPKELTEVAGAVFRSDAEYTLDVRSRITAGMLGRFWNYYQHLPEKTFMPVYRRKSCLLGKEVYTLTEPPVYGQAVDIDEDGHLILKLADGSRLALSSGEVSVRPVK